MDRFRRPIAVLATFLVAASVSVAPPASARPEPIRLAKLDRRVRVAEKRLDRRLTALEERIATLEGAALPGAEVFATGRPGGGGVTAKSLGRRTRRLERRTQRRLRQLERRVGQLEAEVDGDTASSSVNIQIGRDRVPRTGPAIRRRARLVQRRAGLFVQEIGPRIVVLEEGARAPSPPLDSGDGPGEGWNGSAGPASVTCPQDAVKVSTQGSLQTAINNAGVGGSLCIGRGVYRLTNRLSPKPAQTLTFEPGAVLNGSKAVTNWTQEGNHWVAGGQTQRFSVPSWMHDHMCGNSPAACIYEDVYMDDEPLRHVTSRAELGPGRVYFDKSADKIYIATDPRAHTIEATVAATAISSGADGVTIRGATIDKFADAGIIIQAKRWTISNSDIRHVHFQGIGVYGGTGHLIRDTLVHHNGVIGMTAVEVSDFTVQGSEFAHNNYLNAGPETGGYHEGSVKVLKSHDVIVRNNYSHHNHGDGWWFDSDNIDITIEGNLLENNQRHGIHYEASFDAVVRANTIRKNGLGGRWNGGTAIFNSTSKNVEYLDNTLEGNMRSIVITWQNRGRSEKYGERQSANLLFHNNTIVFPEATHPSMWLGVGVYPNQDPRAWTANNRFENNRYYAADMSRTWWQWSGGVTWEKWQSRGFDDTGSYSSI